MAKTQQKIAPVYLILTGDFMIAAPPREVWLHVLNYPSWQNYPVVEHVSGPSGQEGELVLLKKEEAGFTFPPYYARTIKLDPARRAIWKTFPQDPATAGEFFGIVEFRLQEEGDQTRFYYNTLYEFQVPYQNESELEAFHNAQYQNFQTLLSSIFPKLKKLAESRT